MAQMSDETYTYTTIIGILQDVKLLEGPLGLTSTLKRHPQVKKWLHDYQARSLTELESELAF